MKTYKQILESEEFDIIRDKCIELFKKMWNKKLMFSKVELYNLNFETKYSRLYIKTFNPFNNKNYYNYKELFDFLQNLKLEFDFTDGSDINIFISDPELFISEIESKLNIKKFNI